MGRDFSTDQSTVAHEFAAAASQFVASAIVDEPLFQELKVVIDASNDVSVRYRLYRNESFLHVFVSSGPFTEENMSTDAILRLETNVSNTRGEFWTDSNGLELVKRTRWNRPWTSLNYSGFAGDEPVAINMYPVTAAAVLADALDPSQPALALVTANSHAATSMSDGSIELTMNRQALDKNRQRLTGNRLVTQHLLLTVAPSCTAATTAIRHASAMLSNAPVLFAHSGALGGDSFAGLSSLPPQLGILSLQLLPENLNISLLLNQSSELSPPVSRATMLLRLRHMFQAGLDDNAAAAAATVDLADVFRSRWDIAAVTEMVVDGSQPLADARAAQVQWQQQAGSRPAVKAAAPSTRVTLQPMEIKTFALILRDQGR